MTGHRRQVCEFGQVHSTCRCASPHKTVERVACTMPEQHRAKQQLAVDAAAEAGGSAGGTGSWIDPPRPAAHSCRPGLPSPRPGDHGRRWLCTCGAVWIVDQIGPGREQGDLFMRRDPDSDQDPT